MSELKDEQLPDGEPWAKTSSGDADSITEDDTDANETQDENED